MRRKKKLLSLKLALRYAAKRIWRSPLPCAALAAVSFAFILMLQELGGMLAQKRASLDALYRELPVNCTVSDATGTQTDGLFCGGVYLSACTDAEHYPLARLVKDVCFRRAIRYTCPAEEAAGEEISEETAQQSKLNGITRIAAAPLLAPEHGVEITWLPGYDETVFESELAVCLIPEDMAQYVEEGELSLVLSVEEYGKLICTLPASFIVAGTYTGASRLIYCPWAAMSALLGAEDCYVYADSISFTATDNYRLDELRRAASVYFAVGAHFSSNVNKQQFALTVHDSILKASAATIRGDIRLLETLIPLLLVLSAGIGFAASFLFMRSRRAEFAVMRSLGTSGAQVFLMAFAEQLSLTLLGMLPGFLAYGLWRGAPRNVGTACIYLACHMAGMAAATLLIMRTNVMEALGAKE